MTGGKYTESSPHLSKEKNCQGNSLQNAELSKDSHSEVSRRFTLGQRTSSSFPEPTKVVIKGVKPRPERGLPEVSHKALDGIAYSSSWRRAGETRHPHPGASFLEDFREEASWRALAGPCPIRRGSSVAGGTRPASPAASA